MWAGDGWVRWHGRVGFFFLVGGDKCPRCFDADSGSAPPTLGPATVAAHEHRSELVEGGQGVGSDGQPGGPRRGPASPPTRKKHKKNDAKKTHPRPPGRRRAWPAILPARLLGQAGRQDGRRAPGQKLASQPVSSVHGLVL